MGRRSTGLRRGLVWALPVMVAVAVAAMASPAPVAALNLSNKSIDPLTLDQQTGGLPTKFQFEASEDASDSISRMTLTFPQGFDLKGANAQVLTIQLPLNRVDVTSTVQITGQNVSVAFDPAIKPPPNVATDVRVTVSNVLTPNKGGTYELGVRYVSNGRAKILNGVDFSYASPTLGQLAAGWLGKQGWVQKWDTAQFFNQFLQPQMAAIAFTTVWAGWLISIALVGLAFPLAIAGGLALAFMKMSKIPPVRWIANIYINVIRGTPLLLQIFIAFVGLPLAGLHVQWFVLGVTVFALNSSGYLAEIFRAGIQSINKGQFEAASSLGMSYPQAMAYVIVPQTVKRVLPTMTSEFIVLFKDTSLLATVGVFELMLYSNNLVATSGNITPFMVAAVFYLIVTIPLINWVARLEARLSQSEGGASGGKRKKKRGALDELAYDVAVTSDPYRNMAPESIEKDGE